MNNLQEQQKELVTKKLQEQQIDNAIKKNKELKLLGYLHSHPCNTIDDLMVLDKIYDLIKAKDNLRR